MIILTKLILAHLLGDFVFQPRQWVVSKEAKKLKAWQFYAHLLVHTFLLVIFLWDSGIVQGCLIVLVSHGLIDAVKLFAQREATKRRWFFIDQILHLLVLVCVWYWTTGPALNFGELLSRNLIFITGYIFVTTPASIVIRFLISKWTPVEVRNQESDLQVQSLQDAGKYIGILERLLTVTFIVIGRWEAVGFLIAAKSIFRFGDLKNSNELKLTEYVLIGTFLSFGIAIATGLFLASVDQSLIR